MAEKGKGNIWYEIGIVVLILLLLWTIRYPSNVWQKETESTNVCRTRMESIQQLELRYITLTNTYTDSMDEMIDVVSSDSNSLVSLDSVILWDSIVEKKDLKSLIYQKSYPEEIRQLISDRLMNGVPLGHLANWDMLKQKLAEELKSIYDSMDSTYISAVLDSGIVWEELVGEDIYLNILETAEMPRRVLRNTNRALQKGTPVYQTPGWEYVRPVFYDSLRSIIYRVLREDIWQADEKEQWAKIRKLQWEESMDTLSAADRDTIWQEFQFSYWDKQNDLIWKKERNGLWKKERKTWVTENEPTWSRIVFQQWQVERKKEWLDDERLSMETAFESWFEDNMKPVINQMQASVTEVDTIEDEMAFIDTVVTASVLPDTFALQPWGHIYAIGKATFSGLTIDDLKADLVGLMQQDSKNEIDEFFKAKKDSVWRSQIDTVWVVEQKVWFKKNKKQVNELIKNLWSRERRVTWDSEAFQRWRNEKQAKSKELWVEIKEELWNRNKDNFWRDEEAKLSQKIAALKKLDRAVVWYKVLGNEKVEALVSGLDLPNTGALWKAVKKMSKEKGSAIYRLGLVDLYRKVLLDSLMRCPVSHTPYLVGVIDTTAIKKLTIDCPIVDTTRVIRAWNINPVTRDTTQIVMRMPITRKLFGGGSIKKHGKIDAEGKKSWEKRGR